MTLETAEQAHFLVRVGAWGVQELERWVQQRKYEDWGSAEEEEIEYSDDGEEQKL